MAKKPTELVSTFLEEHRSVMRGLADLLHSVQSGDLPGARAQADRLDQLAGPHIEFEEEVLYPEVGRAQGGELERQLRDEHSIIRQALQRLSRADEAQAGHPEFREEITAALQTAIHHAESCGTLITHLYRLPETQQSEALKRLIQLRARRRRWTQLPSGSAQD